MEDPRSQESVRTVTVILLAVAAGWSPALAVEEWQLAGGVTVRACVAERCGRSREPFTARLLLDVDEVRCRAAPPRVPTPCGAYRVVRGGQGCRPGTVTPDEVGIVVVRRRRWRLEPTNMDEIVAALRRCVPGRSLVVEGYSHAFNLRRTFRKVKATGHATLRFTLHLGGRVLDVRSRAAYRATPPP